MAEAVSSQTMTRPLVQPSVRWLGVAAGLLYGLLFRLVFVRSQSAGWLGIMSVAFVLGVPFVLGFLQVYISEAQGRRSWFERIFMPWLSALLCLAAALVLAWEGLICIVLLGPIMLLMASLGGISAALIRDFVVPARANFVVAFCVVLPLVISPLERSLQPRPELRTVASAIEIHASRQNIWDHIKRVAPIRPDELRRTWTQRIGFPRPIEATLSYEGVGGVRHASFEGGVVFIETITRWLPESELTFTISADPANIPASTLDEHVTVGGPYFDVLEGDYRIQPLGSERSILHLASRHRLSTHFNLYSSLWSDAIMRDIQDNILGVIKARCEDARP